MTFSPVIRDLLQCAGKFISTLYNKKLERGCHFYSLIIALRFEWYIVFSMLTAPALGMSVSDCHWPGLHFDSDWNISASTRWITNCHFVHTSICSQENKLWLHWSTGFLSNATHRLTCLGFNEISWQLLDGLSLTEWILMTLLICWLLMVVCTC